MEIFKNEKTLEKWIRTRASLPPTGYMKLAGVIYTLDCYDSEGEYISYGNKRTGNKVEVTTENRYDKTQNPFRDAKVTLLPAVGYYTHINYAD